MKHIVEWGKAALVGLPLAALLIGGAELPAPWNAISFGLGAVAFVALLVYCVRLLGGPWDEWDELDDD